MSHNLFNTLQTFTTEKGRSGQFYSLPQLEQEGVGPVSRLPVSIRVVLESVLRNFDGKVVEESDVRSLASWKGTAERTEEVPFYVARVLLQDFTGVPLLVDLAAMRSAVQRMGRDPKIIEPLVPVDLVIDHSVQVDFWSSAEALRLNMETEFRRNRSRYQFLKWGMQAFESFNVVPPGIGIVGWGVGGIEAEAAMLGQPVYILTPDVVGVNLTGSLREGVTATDLVLRVTEMLRKAKVVGKFVEFHGEGAASIPVADRATIGNMAPEYGATMGYFPIDEKSCEYLLATGRTEEQVDVFRAYYQAQGLFGIPRAGEIDYSTTLELDLSTIEPSVAGPKRPQDRIELSGLKEKFTDLLRKPAGESGYNRPEEELDERFHVDLSREVHEAARSLPVLPGALHSGGGGQEQESAPNVVATETVGSLGSRRDRNTNAATEFEMMNNRPTPDRVDFEEQTAEFIVQPEGGAELGHGDVVIAAITSCTNTSNPGVMLAAGLLAKKAVERGLKVAPTVKPSLAPGSRVVTDYYEKTGLQKYLDKLGFNVVGYGCTTCIGNSGPLDPRIENVINEHDLVTASVLSGNRNFEARVHQSV